MGGEWGVFDLSGKWGLVFYNFFFIGCIKRCGDPLSQNIRFKEITFSRCLRSVFILSCYLILFDVFEGELSFSNINRTSTFNFPAEN